MADTLYFDTATWLVWLAPFLGVLSAGLTRRRDPVIEGGRVLRHDGAARLEHWTHGLGTLALLITGIALGSIFTPSLAKDAAGTWAWMNAHYLAVLIFLFGTFYYSANTLLSPERFKEHLPSSHALDYTRRHYGRLLGDKKLQMPPEGKYFESEKMAYYLALASTAAIIATGLTKVLAHSMDLPSGLMGIITPLHDIAASAMLLFFAAHVLMAAILPMGWPMLVSMITGYVTLEHARAEHAGWVAELEGKPAPKG